MPRSTATDLIAYVITPVLAFLPPACSVVREQELVTAPSGVADLPARTVDGFFLVRCSVNGRGPLDLVLDTGSAWLVLDAAKEAGWGRDPADVFTAESVRVGPVEVRHLPAQVRDLTALSKALGEDIDGILPYTFFRDLLLTIDYAAERVVVSRGRITNDGNLAVVPTDAFAVRPFVALSIHGTERRVLIDSGSGVEVALASGSGLEWEEPPKEIGRAVMIDGVHVRFAGRALGSASVGALTVESPRVDLGVDEPRVGNAFLRRARWTFDQRSMLVRVTVPPEAEHGGPGKSKQ